MSALQDAVVKVLDKAGYDSEDYHWDQGLHVDPILGKATEELLNKDGRFGKVAYSSIKGIIQFSIATVMQWKKREGAAVQISSIDDLRKSVDRVLAKGMVRLGDDYIWDGGLLPAGKTVGENIVDILNYSGRFGRTTYVGGTANGEVVFSNDIIQQWRSRTSETMKIFSDAEVENMKADLLVSLVDQVPFVRVSVSSLGGAGRNTLMVIFSLDEKDTWVNGILENSRYARISIDQDGEVKNFSGTRPFMRSFHAKSFNEVVDKIERYINQRNALKTSAVVASELVAVSKALLAEDANGQDFEPAFQEFLAYCNSMVSDYYAKNYTRVKGPEIQAQRGQRYVRLAAVEPVSKSAWGFVDIATGDVLKAASWATPAKHARASIYDKSTWKNVGPYGPASMRRG